MADTVREALATGFRNEKHKSQWKMTLETYAGPLRSKPVDTIMTDDVLAVPLAASPVLLVVEVKAKFLFEARRDRHQRRHPIGLRLLGRRNHVEPGSDEGCGRTGI